MWLFSFRVERWVIHRVNVAVNYVGWVLARRWMRVFGLGGNGAFLNGRYPIVTQAIQIVRRGFYNLSLFVICLFVSAQS